MSTYKKHKISFSSTFPKPIKPSNKNLNSINDDVAGDFSTNRKHVSSLDVPSSASNTCAIKNFPLKKYTRAVWIVGGMVHFFNSNSTCCCCYGSPFIMEHNCISVHQTAQHISIPSIWPTWLAGISDWDCV